MAVVETLGGGAEKPLHARKQCGFRVSGTMWKGPDTRQYVCTFRVRTVLNLDGGGSTGLWANAQPQAVSVPELSKVRNYLAIRLK